MLNRIIEMKYVCFVNGRNEIEYRNGTMKSITSSDELHWIIIVFIVRIVFLLSYPVALFWSLRSHVRLSSASFVLFIFDEAVVRSTREQNH